jgi:hypothetical protein
MNAPADKVPLKFYRADDPRSNDRIVMLAIRRAKAGLPLTRKQKMAVLYFSAQSLELTETK